MPTLLENFNEVKAVLPQLKKCAVEFKQVTFPQDKSQATYYLVAKKDGAREYVSETLTASEVEAIDHFI